MRARATNQRALRVVTEPVETLALMTVVEAADTLRIGRSLAYTLAREYVESGGTSGLPVLRFGACLRVPRWALVERATTGRVVRLGSEAEARRVPSRAFVRARPARCAW